MVLFLYKKLIEGRWLYMTMAKMRFLFLIASLTSLTFLADGFLFTQINNKRRTSLLRPSLLRPSLLRPSLLRPSSQLRNSNSNSNIALCNEKYVYMRYLIGIRNFKRVYRIVKDNHFADIQNAINILNVLNYLNNTQGTQMTIMKDNNAMQINNTDKIAKTLILSNIYIDVSTVKYIQISTKNDTLIVELDKNNANALYDIGKIDNFLSSISLLMKIINIT
jgi:hypothetical protein